MNSKILNVSKRNVIDYKLDESPDITYIGNIKALTKRMQSIATNSIGFCKFNSTKEYNEFEEFLSLFDIIKIIIKKIKE